MGIMAKEFSLLLVIVHQNRQQFVSVNLFMHAYAGCNLQIIVSSYYVAS